MYPESRTRLEEMIRRALVDASVGDGQRWPDAIVAPHGSYPRCGAVIAETYGRFAECPYDVEQVVIVGPSHFFGFDGMVLPDYTAFKTPLGQVHIDESLRQQVLEFDFVSVDSQPHQPEYSLEVHLPFIQFVLGAEVEVLPLLSGTVDREDVQMLLETVWGDDEVLVAVSTDLSHHHDAETARSIDEETMKFVEQYYSESIRMSRACGYQSLRGLVRFANERELEVETYRLCNSADSGGKRSQVIGFGAWGFYES